MTIDPLSVFCRPGSVELGWVLRCGPPDQANPMRGAGKRRTYGRTVPMGGDVAHVGVTPRSLEAVRWQVRDWLQRLPAAVRANDNSTRPALAGRSCSTNPRNRLLRGRCTGWKGRGTTECSAAAVISTPSDHVEDWPGTRPGAPAGSSECCLTWGVPTLFLRAAFLYIMGGTEGSQPAAEWCSHDVCHRRAVHRRAGPGLR